MPASYQASRPSRTRARRAVQRDVGEPAVAHQRGDRARSPWRRPPPRSRPSRPRSRPRASSCGSSASRRSRSASAGSSRRRPRSSSEMQVGIMLPMKNAGSFARAAGSAESDSRMCERAPFANTIPVADLAGERDHLLAQRREHDRRLLARRARSARSAGDERADVAERRPRLHAQPVERRTVRDADAEAEATARELVDRATRSARSPRRGAGRCSRCWCRRGSARSRSASASHRPRPSPKLGQ